MFEKALLTATSLGPDPVAADDVVWHSDRGEWVALEPSDLVDDELRSQVDRLAEQYAAAPAAGAFPFDAGDVSPGPELAAALAAFETVSADGYDLVEAAAELGRLASWVAAKEAHVLAKLAARPELRPAETGYRSVNPITNTAVEIAGRCLLTARQAENVVGHAVQLVEDFPDTWAALEAGLIDLRRVRAITDELGGQDPTIRARIEAAVLPEAPFLDSVALRKLIKRLLLELAPLEAAERHRIARDRRYVCVTPASDGMAFLEAYLPAEDATALDTALNVAAADAKRVDAAAGLPGRTRDQRRADALADLGWAGGPGAAPPNTPGAVRRRPVAVNVTIPFTALVGLTDEPGELEGYGPIPAEVARKLAAEGVWTWLKTDPGTGHLLDVGRTRYRPSKALADFVTARDRTCRMPGCHRPGQLPRPVRDPPPAQAPWRLARHPRP
jgi:hypothetical protein